MAQKPLREYILEVVDAHSGGLKGLELMTELFLRMGAELLDVTNGVRFMEEIEQTVEEMPELGLLRYGMKLDDTMYREKIFVFRKLGERCCHETVKPH